MFCYMPTWSLTSAIAMANCPSEQFAWIRVFGSIGWFASGVFSLVAAYFFTGTDGKLAIDGTQYPAVMWSRHGGRCGDPEPDAAEYPAARQG